MSINKRYYAEDNVFGTSTSHGFANTWFVLMFTDKKERDEYVDNSRRLTTRVIKAKDVRKKNIRSVVLSGVIHWCEYVDEELYVGDPFSPYNQERV